ncbi:MAG TPA: STAS domain-containing protein [Labilithrix sp.]|nr:STAS domain-containing protein [Labilithrix sp.]
MVTSTALGRIASFSSSLMAVLSSEGFVEEANAAMVGLAANGDVVSGRPFTELVHVEDRAAVAERLRRLEPGTSIEFRARLGRPVGAARAELAQFEATRSSEGEIYVVAIPSTSIETTTGETSSNTRGKLADRQLAELDGYLATVELLPQALRLAPVILWASDARGQGTHLDGGALPAVGLDNETDPSTINIFDMFADRPDLLAAFRRTLAGETVEHEATFGSATLEAWFVPSRDGEGEVNGFIGLFVDVTTRVESAAELREKLETIEQQNAMIRALMTPIVHVWEGVLLLPLIGVVDSTRAEEMMVALLGAIARDAPRYVVMDLTGVENVDTNTAELILRLFRAAKLMGSEGILCGIRPAVAQAITGLGLDLGTVRTQRSLQRALEWCIQAEDAHERAL